MAKKLFSSFVYGATGFTPDGGVYQTFYHKTGASSVKGAIVMSSAGTDSAVDIASASTYFAIGVIYEDGIADGFPVKVVVYGRAQVLLRNAEASTRGVLVCFERHSRWPDDAERGLAAALYGLCRGHRHQPGGQKRVGTNLLAWVQAAVQLSFYWHAFFKMLRRIANACISFHIQTKI